MQSIVRHAAQIMITPAFRDLPILQPRLYFDH